ncbi:MAG: type II secretion system F family protein [Candidatus Pacearchaeota archaeon]
MKFKIPFTISSLNVLNSRSKYFLKFVKFKGVNLDNHLKNAGLNIDGKTYLSIIYRNFILNFFILLIILTSIFVLLKVKQFYLYGLIMAAIISGFIFFNQYNYPRIYSLNKTRDIEKNLIPLMQDVLVQLNSGVTIFRILSNIAESDYGEASNEFKRIVNEINSGTPQIDAIEKYAKINTSHYFRRVLWQLSNGMRAGSDISVVVKEEIKNLGEEQAIQIQSYGGKLNPLVMFFMIIAVILPTLGTTFLIIIASIIGISGNMVKLMFISIFIFILFVQIMFLGLIKSRRPSLI